MGWILDKAHEREIKINLGGVPWGFNVHPSTVQDRASELPGEFVVLFWWLPFWRDRKNRETYLKEAQSFHDAGKKIILRVEDPAVRNEDFGEPMEPVSDGWWARKHLPFLTDVLSEAKDIIWGVQTYNEPFLSMRGRNGTMTPEEVVWLTKKGFEALAYLAPDLVSLMPGTENYHDKQWRGLWNRCLDLGLCRYTDMFNLHIYTSRPEQVAHYYEDLQKRMEAAYCNRMVFLSEVNGPEKLNAEDRWKCIAKTVSLLKNSGMDLKGACVYSWQEPDYSKATWTAKGTVTETRVRTLAEMNK